MGDSNQRWSESGERSLDAMAVARQDIFVETAPKERSPTSQGNRRGGKQERATQTLSQNKVLEHLWFLQSHTRRPQNGWYIDSAASSHMTCKRELLKDYKEGPEKVSLGDGRTVEAVGVGNVHLNMQFKVSDPKRCVMYGVLYIPKLACNLFSLRVAASKGNVVRFASTKCLIRNNKGNLCGMGHYKIKCCYQLNCEPVLQEKASVASEKASTEGKMQRKPFKPVGEICSKRKLQCVHSDVCGPMPTESILGRKYYVTLIDDYSRCCTVYFMRQKSEMLDRFKEFEAATTTDSGQRICPLRSDNGGEHVSQEFEAYLKPKGIGHELTVSYSPQQAERMNRILMESARSMLAHAGLPDSYWAEAVATTAN